MVVEKRRSVEIRMTAEAIESAPATPEQRSIRDRPFPRRRHSRRWWGDRKR
jgi:hypothetical protein